ncbi:hypothetical protein JMG10_22960 [Nostoc ellipsosporum NOK]|nr:hypothetical protein [Nostoc ellipsosporum NOK]
MNRDAPGTRKQGSWLVAWLGGSLVALGLTLAALLAWMSARSNSQPAGGVGGDTPLTTLYATPYLAVAMGVTLFLLITLAMLAERRASRPLLFWLVLGFAATTPLAFVVWALQHLGDCFEDCRQSSELWTIPPVLAAYAFGMSGAAAAFRLRHGNWR